MILKVEITVLKTGGEHPSSPFHLPTVWLLTAGTYRTYRALNTIDQNLQSASKFNLVNSVL